MATKKKSAAKKKAPAKKVVKTARIPVMAKPKAGTSKEAAASRKRLFVEAFLANGGNATAAAKAAGFAERSAHNAGCRMVKDSEVLVMLAARQEKLAAKFELTTEAVLRNLSQAIFFDPRKLYRPDGTLKPVHELDDDTAQALAGFEVTEEVSGKGEDRVVGFTKKVKWLDKNTAREQAMKHLGQYREDNKQRSPLDGIPREMLKELAERLRG